MVWNRIDEGKRVKQTKWHICLISGIIASQKAKQKQAQKTFVGPLHSLLFNSLIRIVIDTKYCYKLNFK